VALTNTLRGGHLARLVGSWRTTRGANGRRLPEYAALAGAVRGLLREGRLPLGVRLPAERELAVELAVSRTTVTAAYRELRETGHLSSRRGAGSWTTLPAGQRITSSGLWAPTADTGVIDLSCAALPAPPELAVAAAEAIEALPRYAEGAGFHPTGLAVLRETVADGFTARGLPTRPDQIIITNGVLGAIDLLLRLLVSPGQTVLVESPSYPNAIAAMRAHRARLVTDNLDPATGWDADLLLGALRAGRPSLAYLIPEFHNPTGHLMPAALRERLSTMAHSAGTDLIIDESFVDLSLDGQSEPPFAAFDRHARVLTVGGMTKPYWGGLRVGWIRAAAPVIDRLAALRVAVDMAGPVLDQLLAASLLARAAEVIPVRRAVLARQRDALVAALRAHLPEWTFAVPAGGVCLWVELEAPVSSALARSAVEHGVQVAPGPRFGVDGTLERFVRLPFTLPEAQLEEAVLRLAAAHEDLGSPHAGAPHMLVA
jgi:DNA-binding transcriptional MocR family regulator